jgi:hypothetical protein
MTKGLITVSVDVGIIEEARRKGINISEAAESGIAQFSGQSIQRIQKLSKVVDLINNSNPLLEEKVIFVMEKPDLGPSKARDIIKRMAGTRLSITEVKEYFKTLKEGKHGK